MGRVENSILADKIAELKKRKRAIILAHYYTAGEVQAVADFVGDSLALSQKAATVDADIILFAGVRFMAETAKVLSPDKKVLLPVVEAGCSLADSCNAEELARVKAEHPDHLVVAYVNTSVEVKALTDICCTSSNALDIVKGLPADQKILFIPDRNLGSYINKCTGRDMKLWDGACLVHEEFSVEEIVKLKEAHPQAKVVVHPECKAEVVELADYAGSTEVSSPIAKIVRRRSLLLPPRVVFSMKWNVLCRIRNFIPYLTRGARDVFRASI